MRGKKKSAAPSPLQLAIWIRLSVFTLALLHALLRHQGEHKNVCSCPRYPTRPGDNSTLVSSPLHYCGYMHYLGIKESTRMFLAILGVQQGKETTLASPLKRENILVT